MPFSLQTLQLRYTATTKLQTIIIPTQQVICQEEMMHCNIILSRIPVRLAFSIILQFSSSDSNFLIRWIAIFNTRIMVDCMGYSAGFLASILLLTLYYSTSSTSLLLFSPVQHSSHFSTLNKVPAELNKF